MRFRKSLAALAATGLVAAGVGVTASPASASPYTTCAHSDALVNGTWYIAYLGHSTTPYGVHYHRYRHTNVVTGSSHTHSQIC